jgi:hypothetical protein
MDVGTFSGLFVISDNIVARAGKRLKSSSVSSLFSETSSNNFETIDEEHGCGKKRMFCASPSVGFY